MPREASPRRRLSLILLTLWATSSHAADCHAPPATTDSPGVTELQLVELPDASLVDHRGRTVRLHELVAGRRVAMNFIFTRCTTVCPPMGALFARLQQRLEKDGDDDVVFLSISIDPARDTPERLAAWAAPFEGSERWTLLTGEKLEVDRLLKALGVFSALIEDHAPLVLLGNEPEKRWLRAYGLAPPDDLATALRELGPAPTPASPIVDETREYFTDTVLVDQHGRERRFYSDLVAGKTVVINPFFARCTGSCPVMHESLSRIEDALGDRVGRDVHLLSITVDPEHDTPEVLRRHAESLDASEGWHFLSGTPENVRRVLSRLGPLSDQKEAHPNVFLIGNDRTGLWQRAFGLDPVERVVAAVRSVADDHLTPDAQLVATATSSANGAD